MRRASPDLAPLRHCLEQEANVLSGFITLLRHEADVLADGAQHDVLATVTEQKTHYAIRLGQQAAERNTILQDMGYDMNKQGLNAARRDHPELSEAIHHIFEQTAHASTLNTSNGRIIARFLSHNQEALDILHQLNGGTTLYDANGHKRPATRSSRIRAR